MESSYARGGHLLKTRTHRQQVTRRRLAVAGAILGLAALSAGVGWLGRTGDQPLGQVHVGPFSYFSTE